MSKRSRASLAAGVVVAASLAVAGGAMGRGGQGPDEVQYTTGKFIITCTSTGQICNPPEKLKVHVNKGKVRIKRLRYRAATTHCSSGRILVSLDGERIGATDYVNAGEQATVDDLKVTLDEGQHRFAFRVQGKVGGCNVGSVVSWGGKITLSGVRLAGK
jgi:hypothetical protein